MKTRLFFAFTLILLAGYCSPACGQYAIVPAPRKMEMREGSFLFSSETRVCYQGPCSNEAALFASFLSDLTGKKIIAEEGANTASAGMILFTCNRSTEDLKGVSIPDLPGNLENRLAAKTSGGYSIVIAPEKIIVSAQAADGVFYGSQTLRQIFEEVSETQTGNSGLSIHALRIQDDARFAHRGLLLDCCRHFMSTALIRRYIDALAYYKMNILHWHLTEDQGWRIEIAAYPELTRVGAWRKEKDGSIYGGFYTQAEIRDIVKYAAERHVTIIPEIELPGHSLAAIASYPWLSCTGEKVEVTPEWGVFKDIYCAGNEETFVFLEKVLTEVADLFPGPYIHIGGDEAPKFRWQNCAKCQKRMSENGLKSEAELQTYFIERIAAFLKKKNKSIIGWDEILEGGIPADAMVQSWRGMEGGEHAAKKGHDAVMSPTSHCYFDYGLSSTDLREVYSFDPIPASLTADEALHIRGGECNMWSEHTPEDIVDSFVFPRLLAMSEVLWTYPTVRDYHAFFLRVLPHYERLKARGIHAGFPAVPVDLKGEVIDESRMRITPIPGFEDSDVVYSMKEYPEKNANTAEQFQPFSGPIEISKPVVISCKAYFRGMEYKHPLIRTFSPHAGAGKALKLSYTPSPYYTGGGLQALADGNLGSSDFRDGRWQALQGSDMEAVVDLGRVMNVASFETHWFHYGNAWIFRPSQVTYFVSEDGIRWKEVESITAQTDEKTDGELVLSYRSDVQADKIRYVKMLAKNNGPCPAWHDAPGEPSWLFCDEIIITGK